MVRERINGGFGVIIPEESVIEKVVGYYNKKYPCNDGTSWTKYDLQDMWQINAVYLDSNSTIAVYPEGKLNSAAHYPESGLIIWAKNEVDMSNMAYFTKASLAAELTKTISKIGINNDVDYEKNSGLILYTEYN